LLLPLSDRIDVVLRFWSHALAFTDFRSQSKLCFCMKAKLNVRGRMVRGQFNIFGAVEEKCGAAMAMEVSEATFAKPRWEPREHAGSGGNGTASTKWLEVRARLSTGRAQELQKEG
jgi:hypothetical protein